MASTSSKPEEVTPPAPSKKRWLIAGALAVLVAGSGGFAWYQSNQEHRPATQKEELVPPVFVVFEPLTVNLQHGEDGDQYLQVALTAQVGEQDHAEMMKQYMPQIRSRLLLLLSSKKAADIATPEGKKKLVDEMLAKIREPYSTHGPGQRVMNLFFTSFVIQ